jgi:hypothetical protein
VWRMRQPNVELAALPPRQNHKDTKFTKNPRRLILSKHLRFRKSNWSIA